MITTADRTPQTRAKWEFAGVVFILLFFLAISLLTATRVPTIFADEVEYVDPAANLYYGNGFTSTFWGQDRQELWCGNVPLYQGMLYCFFKVFGFGLLQARMCNAVLTAMAALLIWAVLWKSRFIHSPALRLTSLALILSGSVSFMTFRTARYDAAMFFVCSLVFFACNLSRPSLRYVAVVFSSALLPMAGVPMIPYTGLFLMICLAVYGMACLRLAVSVGVGIAAGTGALFAFYRHFGLWKRFLEIVFSFTSAVHTKESHPLKTIFLGDSLGSENIPTSFFGNPLQFVDHKTLFDYSAFILFILVVLMTIKIWKTANHDNRRRIIFIFAITLVIPPFMHLAGHYRSFYRWMTYIPLAIVLPRLLELALKTGWTKPAYTLALTGICLSLFLGLPIRTLLAIRDWRPRSTKPMEQMVRQIAQPSDKVLCSCRTYFAFRPITKFLYCTTLPMRGELNRIKDFPAADITLLCVYPTDLMETTNFVGGHWKKVPLGDSPEAIALAKTRYPVDFYRRDKNNQ